MLRTTPGTHQLTSSMITSPFSSSRKMEIVFSRINSSFSFSDTFPIYKILILSPSFKLGTRSLDILFVLTCKIGRPVRNSIHSIKHHHSQFHLLNWYFEVRVTRQHSRRGAYIPFHSISTVLSPLVAEFFEKNFLNISSANRSCSTFAFSMVILNPPVCFGPCPCQHHGAYTRNVYSAIPTKQPA